MSSQPILETHLVGSFTAANMQRNSDYFLYSSSSSYPNPLAVLINRQGNELHHWMSDMLQPHNGPEVPSFLRGWNHVELDETGSVYAIVPLKGLLKLSSSSRVLFCTEISAHHDLDILSDGSVLVLTEVPKLIELENNTHVILDNMITKVDTAGNVRGEISVYDILVNNIVLRELIENLAVCKLATFVRDVAAKSVLDYLGISKREIEEIASSSTTTGLTVILTALRRLPGSPCDILHSNTIEVLNAHPNGVWSAGCILISLRNLGAVVVIDPSSWDVVKILGLGKLSGQHQPSMLKNGNILVFDNGVAHRRSRLIELDSDSDTVGWKYQGAEDSPFFSEVAGGCELLENGNILATVAKDGRVFEVTRSGAICWDWRFSKHSIESASSRVSLYRVSSVSDAAVRRILRGIKCSN